MSSLSTPETGPPRPWAWSLLVFTTLGLVALLLPWFRPTIDGHAVAGEATTHSWNGLLFFLAPLLMIYAVLRAFRPSSRTSAAGTNALVIAAGALSLIIALVNWLRVPTDYADWPAAQAYARGAGQSLGRGPLIGFWLTIAVGALFVGSGTYAVIRTATTGADEPADAAGVGRSPSPIEPIPDLELYAPPRREGGGRHSA